MDASGKRPSTTIIIVTGVIVGTALFLFAIFLGTSIDYAFFPKETTAEPQRVMLLIGLHWFGLVYILGPLHSYARGVLANGVFIILPVLLGLLLAYGGAPMFFWYGLTVSSVSSGYNIIVTFAKRS